MSETYEKSKTSLINSRGKQVQEVLLNRHDVAIAWFDCELDRNAEHTQHALTNLNYKVEIFTDFDIFRYYLRNCEESLLLILSNKCPDKYLHAFNSFSSIGSIIMFDSDTSDMKQFIQSVRHWIDFKSRLYFYIWNQTHQEARFLANFLLIQIVVRLSSERLLHEMLEICYESFEQHDELHEFELTYTSTDAVRWYTRESFVYKIVNRILRSFDLEKLRTIAFYIQDLRKQLNENRLITNKQMNLTVYHGLAMTQTDLDRIRTIEFGSLLSVNSFLSTTRNRDTTMDLLKKKENSFSFKLHQVLLKINLAVDDSPVICADIKHISSFPDENEILFDIGTILSLENMIYDNENQLHILELSIATQENYRIKDTLVQDTDVNNIQQNSHRFISIANECKYEPILYFVIDNELMESQREHLSSMFVNQHRRFINKQMTQEDMNEYLEKFDSIFYIHTNLPEFMENNHRIAFYNWKLLANENDPLFEIKSIERLIRDLLHQLAMFYAKQSKTLIDTQSNSTIENKFRMKAAKCYELLAAQSSKSQIPLSPTARPTNPFESQPRLCIYDPNTSIQSAAEQLRPFESLPEIYRTENELCFQLNHAQQNQLFLLLIFSTSNDLDVQNFLNTHVRDNTRIRSVYLIFPDGIQFHETLIHTITMPKLEWCRSFSDHLIDNIHDVCKTTCDQLITFYEQRKRQAENSIDNINSQDSSISLVNYCENYIRIYANILKSYYLTICDSLNH